jgi:hypothetical protein
MTAIFSTKDILDELMFTKIIWLKFDLIFKQNLDGLNKILFTLHHWDTR